jgi:DNA mismatch repair protein MutS
MGDFYETFDEDAEVTSELLDIVLTSRELGKGNRVPLAGIPYHSLDNYLARLVKAGYKVAICEQFGDSNSGKGLVDRAVTRVVTPGTVLESYLLDQSSNNYLASVIVGSHEAGFSYVDISTGEFFVTQINMDDLRLELDRVKPTELLMRADSVNSFSSPGSMVTVIENQTDISTEEAGRKLKQHFGVATLEPFGIDSKPLAILAATAILDYIEKTQFASLQYLSDLRSYSPNSYMVLDAQTRRNLELFQSERWGNRSHSLLGTLDFTATPMGGRLLRVWIGQPLLDIDALKRRQSIVDILCNDQILREDIRGALKDVPDLERILNRIVSSIAIPREMISLKNGLVAVSRLEDILRQSDNYSVFVTRELNLCTEVISLVESSLEDVNVHDSSQPQIIKTGFSSELDKIRDIWKSSRNHIALIEAEERERTGVKSLKVGYNRIFGYYIEISKANLVYVPNDYIRRQTLVNAERFITPQLKEFEETLLNAQGAIEQLENSLYKYVCSEVVGFIDKINDIAVFIADIDVLSSFAEVASKYAYVKPILDESGSIKITNGRHPVLDKILKAGSFVPNDADLSNNESQLIVLTGPNMSGKSTYIRQVALIVLMAQIGSFVPAEAASIGLVDRIFTRVGLQDDLSTGQSTFMVEMVETSAILRHASPRSLIILDEIGRGTSTYDGLAIARSVAEYIHNDPRLGCKTLFATHYNELTKLSQLLPRMRNYSVAVSEYDGEVVFLHRIIPGGADKSYGIHVAHLAGLPPSVVKRAWDLLGELEIEGMPSVIKQKPLFSIPHPAIEKLLDLDIANMTPIDAINILYELQSKAKIPE